MRDALSKVLVQLANDDPRVVVLTGDHGYALFDEFRKTHPASFINCGIAEQNMVGVAAGLAKGGFRPIVYGLSSFVPIRVLEQIKLDVAHDNLPVIFLGDGAGFVYSHLGTSHQSTEDIASLRAIPNVQIISPADRHELVAGLFKAHSDAAPVYIRIGKADIGDVHANLDRDDNLPMHLIASANEDKPKMSFIGTGSMASVAKRLATEAFPGSVAWSVPYLSKLKAEHIVKMSADTQLVVTLEEHSINGGLGGAIAELLGETHPKPILRIGVKNNFSKTCGTYQHLLKEHELDFESVVHQVSAKLDSLED